VPADTVMPFLSLGSPV